MLLTDKFNLYSSRKFSNRIYGVRVECKNEITEEKLKEILQIVVKAYDHDVCLEDPRFENGDQEKIAAEILELYHNQKIHLSFLVHRGA